ncbi:MAG: hypothetical protein WBA97_05935 [Actinophytocola sp.]|uniref:hypothetical protein n=1 Tax=Actinophytocola sp. TaxID=1872138 RepID=UPI003C78B6C3
MLLAEHVAEPLSALRELMNPDAVRALDQVHHGDLTSLQVDWPNFLDEHPATTGDARPWLTRLVTALGPDLLDT